MLFIISCISSINKTRSYYLPHACYASWGQSKLSFFLRLKTQVNIISIVSIQVDKKQLDRYIQIEKDIQQLESQSVLKVIKRSVDYNNTV